MTERPHRCQAIECMEKVEFTRLMCEKHWSLVPDSLKWTLFELWEQGVAHDQQPKRIQGFISMAVQQVAIVERKAMT